MKKKKVNKLLKKYYSSLLSMESMIKYGYYDSIANKYIKKNGSLDDINYIDNDQFYNNIFNLEDFAKWVTTGAGRNYFSGGNIGAPRDKVEKYKTQPISFTIPKDNYTRREYKLPNLYSYSNTAAYLEAKSDDIIKIFMKNNNSLSKYFNFKSYGFRQTHEIKNIQLQGYNKRFYTDLSNFYHSLYTHSIEWVIEGKSNSKKNLNNPKNNTIGHNLDRLMQNSQYGETHGIPTGNLATRVIAELYMCKFDEIMERNGYKYSRYVDDITYPFNKDEDLLKFQRFFHKLLKDSSLSINDKKTRVENFPFSNNYSKDGIFNYFEGMDSTYMHARTKKTITMYIRNRMKDFVDFCLEEEASGNKGSVKCIYPVIHKVLSDKGKIDLMLRGFCKNNREKFSKSSLINEIFTEIDPLTNTSLYEKIFNTTLLDSKLSQKFIFLTKNLIALGVDQQRAKSIIKGYFLKGRYKEIHRKNINHYIDNKYSQELYSYLLLCILFDAEELFNKSLIRKILRSNIDDINMILGIIIFYKKNKNFDGIIVDICKSLHPICPHYDGKKKSKIYLWQNGCDCSKMDGELWMFRYFIYCMSSFPIRNRPIYKDFKNSIKKFEKQLNLDVHLTICKNPSNGSPVHNFYKKMLKDETHIISDGNGKFEYYIT